MGNIECQGLCIQEQEIDIKGKNEEITIEPLVLRESKMRERK